MASSELSSSEINQGQGFYHDGKNEMPGVPALPEPVAPNQIVIEAEDGMWKKYSSHYEFPLSLVIAVGIHVIAILFVVAFMTISFYFGAPKPPENSMVIVEPRVNQEGNNDKEREGGGSGDNSDRTHEVFDPIQLKTPDPINTKDTDPKLPPKLVDTPRPKNKTSNPGTGIGDGSGPGIGRGDGQGVPMARNKRWRIHFSYDEPELFLAQLANLQVTVACRLNNGHFLVFKELTTTGPIKYDDMSDAAFASFVNEAKKLWFINNDRVTADNFAYAVNLSDRPLTLVMIVPNDMEKAILAAELKHHKMTEDEIRTRRLVSSFKVVRDGANWNVTVTKTEVLK